jgi:ubiquinone/menaquinone biosynthesis C-methylase UbiE
MTLILDVGCGPTPRGDVNVDFWTGYTPHTMRKINPQNTQNFLKVDAHFLPFKDQSFDIAISFHVLEHLENPFKALNEMRRVAKEVRIRVPIREFNRYIIESLGLLHTFLAIPFLKTTKHFERQFNSVLRWKERTKSHRWIVRLKNYDHKKIRRKYFVPIDIHYVTRRRGAYKPRHDCSILNPQSSG